MSINSTNDMMLSHHAPSWAITEPYTAFGEYCEATDHLIAHYGPSRPARVRSPYRRRVCPGCGVVARADVFGFTQPGVCSRFCKRCAVKE